MTNHEKFEGFKQKLIDENEQRFGKDVRAKGKHRDGSSASKQWDDCQGNRKDGNVKPQEAEGRFICF